MSLVSSKIVYIFLDTADLSAQRYFLEHILGLGLIESDYHPPHHRHGVLKYDAGNTILALNIADSGFEPASSDNIVMLLGATPAREAEIYADLQIDGYPAPAEPGAVFRDRDNHQFAIRRQRFSRGDASVSIDELHLVVDDIGRSMHFYAERLGLELVQKMQASLTFSCGNVKLVLHAPSPSGGARPRRGFLTVFSTENIRETHDALEQQGIVFPAPVRFSEIGGTVRFLDPSGHAFCLYEPSRECLSWGSGPKLLALMETKAQYSKAMVQ